MSDADPSPPYPEANPAASAELDGLDPGELLARGLNTVEPTGGARGWNPPTLEELSRLLPQYRIECLLGRGGMGAVYKGIQPELERPVAIKLLPAEVATDAAFVARFKREARTLAKLQHSRIITIHDFGQTSDGHLYFVMEYIDGTDLRRILRGPGLAPDQALIVVGQLCDALQAAHRVGVVHRDIKPENVLITRDGYVKLADFGLARPAAEAGADEITSAEVVMGTPGYMAPEQFAGASQADHRSDIYSLGVMLYEMLTGKKPGGVFDPPSSRMGGVQIDVRLDEVVLKALQNEPERRYQVASDLKDAVERIRTTPQPVPAKTSAKGPANHRAKMLIAVLTTLVLFTAVGLYRYFPKSGLSADHGKADTIPGDASVPQKAAEKLVSLQPPVLAAGRFKATGDRPFVNSLGMRFVPVSGTDTLFSIWETRVRDYAEYAAGNEIDGTWRHVRWFDKQFDDRPEDPVMCVNFYDAKAFCEWLTKREKTTGGLPAGQCYRLPTDAEWSLAVGLGVEEGHTPKERSDQNQTLYPWGVEYPPKSKVGNYADLTFKASYPYRQIIADYDDGFALIAPVGSFPPNQFGIYDLGGNAAEWCSDLYSSDRESVVARGAAFPFPTGNERDLLASHRMEMATHYRFNWMGFRCVLAAEEPSQNIPAQSMPAATVSSRRPDAGGQGQGPAVANQAARPTTPSKLVAQIPTPPTAPTATPPPQKGSPVFSFHSASYSWQNRFADDALWPPGEGWRRDGPGRSTTGSFGTCVFPETMTDSAIRVRFRYLSGTGFLDLFMRSSSANERGLRYVATTWLNENSGVQIRIWPTENGGFKGLALTGLGRMEAGEEHTVEFYVQGSQLSYYFDGRLAASAQDANRKQGRYGLFTAQQIQLLRVETATPVASGAVASPPATEPAITP